MTKTVNVNKLSTFDMAQHLQTDADVAEYLSQVLQDNEPGELAAALGHIARARGMTEIAKASGIKREALYKALRADAKPRLDTIQRVCQALGVKLTATVARWYEAITLTQNDFAAFLDALDAPAPASPALQRALQRHAEQVPPWMLGTDENPWAPGPAPQRDKQNRMHEKRDKNLFLAE